MPRRLTRASRLEWETLHEPFPSAHGFEDIYNSGSALEYVHRHVNGMDTFQLETVLRLYNGMSKKGRIWFGGSGPHSDLDPKIKNFLDALDTFHDYKEYAKDFSAIVPKGTPKLSHWNEEWTIIRFLSSHAEFKFGRKRVPNPMFGATFWKELDYPNDEPDVNALFHRQEASIQNRLTQTHERLLPIDIPAYSHANLKDRKYLRFRSVVLTARSLATWFGTNARFLLDAADENLVTYFTGICEVSNILKLGFDTAKRISHIKKAIREACNAPALEFSRWASDANIWDSAPLAQWTRMDMQPTGRINATVELLGLKTDAQNEYRLDVVLAGEKVSLTKDECNQLSSKNNVQAADLLKATKYTREQLHDMKRAGDQGQVLHAQKYGYTVITRDKYMALYAFALKVPFVLIRRRRPLIDRHLFLEMHSWLLGRAQNAFK